MPGEFLDNGADTLTFIKDASADLPWLNYETVTYNQLLMFSFGIPPIIVLAVKTFPRPSEFTYCIIDCLFLFSFFYQDC